MMIKFNSDELKKARKEILKDISTQQIRRALNDAVEKVISDKIESHIKGLSSWNSMEHKVDNAIKKTVEKIIRQKGFNKAITLQEVTKDDVLKRVDIRKIEREVKASLRNDILDRLRS